MKIANDKKPQITVTALTSGKKEKITLPKGVTGEVRVGDSGRQSATIEGFGYSVVVRERKRGNLQLRASWLSEVTEANGDRMSLDTKDWAEALASGVEALKLAYEMASEQDGITLRSHGVTLFDAIAELRSNDLLPGGDPTPRGQKTRKQYEFVLDLAEAILPENPILPLRKCHVEAFYAARSKEHGADRGNSGSAAVDEPSTAWPAHIEGRRKPFGRVARKTVQKNLEDLRSALRRLMIHTSRNGAPFLSVEPLGSLDLGNHEGEARASAGPTRLGILLGCSDKATELMRTEGLEVEENRTGTDSKGNPIIRVHRYAKKLPNVVPGMLTFMLCHATVHPTRPNSLWHVRMDDIARTRDALVEVLRGMDFKKRDWSPPDRIFDLWGHGAIRYRREHSKLDAERLVPMTVELLEALDLYLAQRAEWLAKWGVSSPWLYPSPRDLTRPISDTDARLLLTKGEKVAREMLKAKGLSPAEHMPELKGSKWYLFRRAWKTSRNELKWQGIRESYYVGDWSYSSGPTADTVYAQPSPLLIQAVVAGIPYTTAIAEENKASSVGDVVRPRPIDLDDLLPDGEDTK